MKVRLIKEAVVLVPNKGHQNFVATGKTIEADSIIEGNPIEIKGKRRGEDFVYKLFYTKDKQYIYLNTIKPMEATEVTLGADSQVSPTTVNFKPAERFNKIKTTGMIIGGIAGFLYSRYKKHDLKKSAIYIAAGAVFGYGAGYVFDKNRKVTITKSK